MEKGLNAGSIFAVIGIWINSKSIYHVPALGLTQTAHLDRNREYTKIILINVPLKIKNGPIKASNFNLASYLSELFIVNAQMFWEGKVNTNTCLDEYFNFYLHF